MRVGVTGASGFIGTTLVRALRERGDHVVRFVRPDTRLDVGDVVRWDPTAGVVDDDDLRRVGTMDAVVHLAGAGIADRRWSAARKEEIRRSRVESTSLLVGALRELDSTPLLACGSAIGYYGSRGDEQLDEHSSGGDDFLALVCAQWEEAAAVLRETGAVVATMRTGIVMSAQGGALKRQIPLFKWGLGGRLSSGRQWLSPISLRDQVRAILFVVGQRLDGPVNLTAPEPATNAQFTTDLARELHRPAIFRVPSLALSAVLGSELASTAVLASQRVVPARLLERGFTFEQPDLASIVSWALDH